MIKIHSLTDSSGGDSRRVEIPQDSDHIDPQESQYRREQRRSYVHRKILQAKDPIYFSPHALIPNKCIT